MFMSITANKIHLEICNQPLQYMIITANRYKMNWSFAMKYDA